MSYSHTQGHHNLNEFIPSYVVKSDYLPTRVQEGSNTQTADLLRRYQQERQQGRVFTQRPVEFNPNRYQSFKVYEDVKVHETISEDQLNRMVKRY